MKKEREIVLHIKLYRIIFLFFLFCIPLEFYGQEFEWVYSSKGTNQNLSIPRGIIRQVITNSNNEIYLSGLLDGYVDLGDGQDGFILNSTSRTISFIAKLSENKEVLWIKELRFASYLINSIALDENENILVGGRAFTNNSISPQLYFNSNPPDPIFPNIFLPTHENLEPQSVYGFIYRLDTNGNYIDSKLFKDIIINAIVKDNLDDIIAVGNTIQYNIAMSTEYRKWGFITKMSSNFNTIWENFFINPNSESNNGFISVACDTQNNIYFTGVCVKSFVYGTSVLQSNESNYFISKMTSDGDESWIIDFHEFPISQVKIDNSDGIYFFANYTSSFSVQFNNQLIQNLPFVMGNELVLFKINIDGNHIWNTPIYGTGQQGLGDFTFNSNNELILAVKSGNYNQFNFSNQNATIETNSNNTVILRVKSNSELIDYKRVFESTENNANTYTICTDIYDNILIGGFFTKSTDFDPHVSNQYILVPELFENYGTGVFFPETRGFLLKLKNCESLPFFGDTYEICSGTVPNPTIGDIKDSGPNVKFYASMSATTPLASTFQLTHGQTYYYENNVSSCSNIGRFPVQINILPKSNPPIVSAVQPCFYQELKLADIDVQGQNLSFYLNASGDESLSDTLYLNPNTTYYVTQNYNNCESNRVPFTVNQITLLANEYDMTICDEDKNNIEIVNLSGYLQYFLDAQISNDFSALYFNSYVDALNNQNAISNVETFTASNQTVFIRLFSTNNSCFEIVELNLSLVYPTEITEVKVYDLAENNTVSIFPYEENFSYSLDGINYQSGNVFNNVSSGEYYAYMKDFATNCSSISDKFYVLTYPKFFTPNGDGINDFWKIKMSQFQYAIDVEIYDRYGKFITNFDKNNGGWDGKHKGKELSATDYWFKIIRTTDKKIIYLGHFSLIR